MNTIQIHAVAAFLFILAVMLAGSIGFNAGVKRERKSWQQFAKLFLRMVER